jgi:hypothetical protein
VSDEDNANVTSHRPQSRASSRIPTRQDDGGDGGACPPSFQSLHIKPLLHTVCLLRFEFVHKGLISESWYSIPFFLPDHLFSSDSVMHFSSSSHALTPFSSAGSSSILLVFLVLKRTFVYSNTGATN